MSGRLFVLGSFVMACCARVPRLPLPGECLLGANFSMETGGKGFNTAVCARRLGADVDCLSAVGDDLFGRFAEPAFVAAGLSPNFLRRFEGMTTGAGIGFIAQDGENCVAVSPGANLALSAADVEIHADAIRAAAMTLATFELGDEVIVAAFAVAREAGRRTLLNPSPFRPIGADLLALTSLLIVNHQEGGALARSRGLSLDPAEPESLRTLAETLFADGVELLVLTLGAQGAVAETPDRSLRQPAYDVATIDTLGAGDAFVAGLATTLAAGEPLVDALRLASSVGALTTTREGTFAALPTREEAALLMATGRERLSQSKV